MENPQKKYIYVHTHTHTYTYIRRNLLTPSMIYYFLYFPCNRRKDSCGRYRQIRQWNERCWCSSGGRKIIENMNQNAPHPPPPSFFPLLNFIFWLRSCPIGHRECIPFCLDTEDDTGLSIHDTLRVIKLKERKMKYPLRVIEMHISIRSPSEWHPWKKTKYVYTSHINNTITILFRSVVEQW